MEAQRNSDMDAICALDPTVGAVMQALCAATSDPELQKQTLWACIALYYTTEELFQQLAVKDSTIRLQPAGRT